MSNKKYNLMKEIGVNDSQLTKDEIYGDKKKAILTMALIRVIEFEDGTHSRVFDDKGDAEQYAIVFGSSGDVMSLDTPQGKVYVSLANENGAVDTIEWPYPKEHIGCCYG